MKNCTKLLPVSLLLASTLAYAEPIDFTLSDLTGDATQLSDYRGQWVVANYWATWCAPCRKEIPDFSSLHDDRDDVVVLGLAYEDAEPAAFISFLEKHPASYPILLTDTFNPPESLGAPLALPTTFLVNPEGEMVQTFVGPIKRIDLEDAIAANQ